MTTWWGTRENVTPRMQLEILGMRQLFNKHEQVHIKNPSTWDVSFYVETLSLDLDTSGYNPEWLVRIKMHQDSNAPKGPVHPTGTYTLKIEYTSEYPAKPPNVYLPSHDVEGVLHTFITGELCLHLHDGERDTGWDPARSTAATYGLWALQWIRTWRYYQKTEKWPSRT